MTTSHKLQRVTWIAFFLVPWAAMAQRDTGAILGTVRDQTGGVIPGAHVSAENEGTGLRLTTETKRDGSYIFTPVRIGSYTVEVEYKGFQRVRHTGLVVNIQGQMLVDFALSPGELSQTVEVTATTPLLQTQNGSVGEVVESRTINNLPLSGRNYTFLARLTAGVTPGQSEGRGLNANGWFAANGTRPAQNNYLLDGIDNNSNNVDFLSGAAYVLKPPVDAISEFKLQTNSFSAEFGRAGGAILNATIKSGSNALHGSLWEFLRNDKFDAADFFQNANGQKKGAFKQNQFGIAAGGPVRKNKMFWFADYEGTRVRQALPKSATVPTAAERASGYSNFSDLIALQSGTRTDALGRTFPIGTLFDPATTRQVGPGARDWVREPFPGNIIPLNRINPNSVKLLNLYPAATTAALNGNYFANVGSFTDVNSFDARMDQNFSEKDQVFLRYSLANRPRYSPGPFPGVADGGGFNDGDEKTRTQGAALSWTHSFQPTLINEARIGFNREHVYRVQAFGDDLSDIPATYGIKGILQTHGNGGLPALNIGGLSRIGASDWLVSERFSNTIQFSENLTKIYGKHTFKGGFEYQHIDFPWLAPPTARGSFSFGGTYTSIPEVGDGSTGRAQFLLKPVTSATKNGDQLIGMVNGVGASNYGGVANVKGYRGIYFQDDWKIMPKLTFNLGLRWDYFTQVGEKYNAQGNYVPEEKKFLIPAKRKGSPAISPSFLNALAGDGIQLVYTDDYGSGLGISQRSNFAPRFGFAYQMTSKLVMRGGYGIYFGAFENRGGYPNLGYNYPFQFSFSFPTADRDSLSPVKFPDGSVATLETGLSKVVMDPALVQAGGGLDLRGIQFHYKTPYVQSYNYTWQYALTNNQTFEAGYVASLSRHLETFIGHNQPTIMLPPGTNTQPYIPLQNFARGSSFASTVGNAHYHSLQAKYSKRVSEGLNFLMAYTWAKTLTNAGDLLSGGAVGGNRAPYLQDFGIGKEMGLAGFDIRHAFVVSGTYNIPVGRGKKWALEGPSDLLLGGWSFNWIGSLYAGQPQTLGCTVSTSVYGCYPLVVGDIYANARTVEHFYSADAFKNPPLATTIGQKDYSPLGGGRTPLIGPGSKKLDFSLFKSFQLKERYRAEFRAESFNLTNTPAFANPGSLNFADKNSFGRIYSTRNNPNDARQLQFALKLYF